MKLIKLLSLVFLIHIICDLKGSEKEKIYNLILSEPEKIPKFVKNYGIEVLNLRDKNNLTPLMYAINYESNNKKPIAVEILIKLGSNVNAIGPKGDTPLMYAIRQKNIKKIELILSKNLNIELKNSAGKTALDIAKENKVSLLLCAANINNFNILRYLIEYDDDINVTDFKGNTALMLACKNSNLQMLNLLLTKLPNLEIKNDEGKTVLDIAKEKKNKDIVNAIEIYNKQKVHYEGIHYIPQKEIVVVIPSYNNEQWCLRCLKSVVSQDYSNFKIIYRDDGSSDKTYKLVHDYVKNNNLEDRVIIKRNDQRRFKAANLYLTIHGLDIDYQIEDDSIVVVMDGDDHFPNKYILKVINKIYHENDVYFTYGGYVEYPSMKRGFDIPTAKKFIDDHSIRTLSTQNTSQLRTFYAWLFKKIKMADFFYEGKFMPMVSDVAKIFPMFEMVEHKFYHIDFPVYMYNRENVINDDKINAKLQTDLGVYLRTKKNYKRLDQIKIIDFQDNNVDLIVLSEDFNSAKNFLDKNLKSLFNYQNVSMLIKGNCGNCDNCDNCNLFPYYDNLKEVLFSVFRDCSSNHVLICTDKYEFDQELNFKFMISLLNKTHSFGFYLNVRNHYNQISKFELLTQNIAALQFTPNSFLGNTSHLDAVLYKKKKILKRLQDMSFDNVEALKNVLLHLNKKHSDIVLFFL